MDLIFPFKAGQDAESRSFSPGFRSAWFRCEIKDMRVRGDHTEYLLEYFDFPGEKLTWTRVDQKPSHGRSRELMLRPSFPQWYLEGHAPEDDKVTDVTAVVKDAWKVGDLVDWWCDSCYWSAKVTKVLGNNKVQVELPKPPIGEGLSYTANSKELRPSLNWSLEKGWTAPLSRAKDEFWYTACLLHASNPEDDSTDTEDEDF